MITPRPYTHIPTKTLERWLVAVATAGRNDEAELIRREISTRAELEEAA